MPSPFGPFGGYRYKPPRRIERNAPGVRMPRHVQQWATLYEAGLSLKRIALDTGWLPGRIRQQAGTFSPSAVRSALLDWGVVLRSSGGRGSTRGSILVRLAELERRVGDIEQWHSRE